MSSFSESNLIKKLEHVTNTQDSIQTLSLWVLHHKTHYRTIVAQWLKCYLKAKSSHQLALFYLANDIVQHAKRKSLNHYLNEFMGALKEAARVTNDAKIVANINRVFNIWQERNIYKKEFIEELRGSLCGEDVKLEVLSKIVSDYSSTEIITEISNIVKTEQHTKNKLKSLVNCKIDFANTDLLNKLKDKSYGDQFSKEFDEATKCLEAIIKAFETEISGRKELLQKLEKAKLFYDIQLKEANTVADAFKNCEVRVSQVKTLLNTFSQNSNSDGITTSQLSSVISMIQQAQNANSMSSLDQRLSMLSTTGQFGLALNQENQAFYNPAYEASYNPNSYPDQYYNPLSQDGNGTQTKGLSSAPTEILEPADMDLGDSDDDEGAKRLGELNNKNLAEDKMKRPMEMPFITPQDLGLFPLIPPPPPPPLPPPALKDYFSEIGEDPFRPTYGVPLMPDMDNNHLPGNSIHNMADRQNRNASSYHHPHNSNHDSNNWRNSSDNRHSRNQSYNASHHNTGHGSRWKGNNSRGSWKRNSYH